MGHGGRPCQLRFLYPAKLSFENEGEIKIFPGELRMRELIISTPFTQEILMKYLWAESK